MVQNASAAEEIKKATEQHFAEGLDVKEDAQLVKQILPRVMENDHAGKPLGLTDPKPDYVYGLKRLRHRRGKKLRRLSQNTKALIGVAPGLEHAWFVVENKGCQDSIESAENQGIRSGGTLVNAKRLLAEKAGRLGIEDEGPDCDSIAFSCAWVPQMANVFVHWHEMTADGESIYHMNKIRGYLMSDGDHVSDFRKDIHNILEYGLLDSYKVRMAALEDDIRRVEAALSEINDGKETNKDKSNDGSDKVSSSRGGEKANSNKETAKTKKTDSSKTIGVIQSDSQIGKGNSAEEEDSSNDEDELGGNYDE